MKERIRIITALFTAAAILGNLAGCATPRSSQAASGPAVAETSAEKTTNGLIPLRVALYSNYITTFADIVDEELHIYEKYGIDFQGYEFSMGIDALNAVTTGSLDIAFVADYAGINRLGSIEGDTDLRIFTQLSDYAPMTLWSDAGITAPEQLRGKKLVTIPGTIHDYLYDKLLEAYNISRDEVEIINVSSGQEALSLAAKGEADTFWVESNEDKFKEYGWDMLLSSADYNCGRYQFGMAGETFLKENKDLVVSWIKATQELIDYIYANEDEAAGLVSGKTAITKEHFSELLHKMNYSLSFTKQAYEKSNELNHWLNDNGYYEKKFDLVQYIDNEAVKEAFPDKTEI